MHKAEIDALVRAHGGRARPVAFLHILRQPALDPADHAFLAEHADELNGLDLLRWRARGEPAHADIILQKIAALAIRDPSGFNHEILEAPGFSLGEAEWIALEALVRGKVPEATAKRLEARGRREPASAPVASAVRTAESLDLGLFDDEGGEGGDFFGMDEDAPAEAAEPGGAGASPSSPPLPQRAQSALDRVQSAPPRTRKTALAREAKALSMVELLALFERSPSPLDERALAAIAMERAPDPSPSAEDWSPVAPRLPDVLYGAVLERAQSSPRGGERAVLLEWLDQHGATRKELLTLTTETLRLEALDQPVLDWLARSWVPRMLTTRTAWERHGVEVVLALIAHRAFTELGELFTLASTGAGDAAKPARKGKAKRPEGTSQGYLEAIHLAFAQALVRLSSEALGAGKEARAMAALSALACLDPPSRVGRALHALRRAQGASGEVLELVALNERLVKRAGARGASLEGLIAAVHALADALGGTD